MLYRYPSDPYERYWVADDSNPMWRYLNSKRNIQPESSMEVPSAVLQKAVQVAGNGTMLNITWQDYTLALQFTVFLHFADFQKSQPRQFNIYFNSHDKPYLYNPPYLAAGVVYSPSLYSDIDGEFNVTLVATAKSVLPPMLNAYEIYTLITHNTPMTFSKDGKQAANLKCTTTPIYKQNIAT